MLSAFSTVAGDQAADLADLAARGLLQEALPVVEHLDECATELARLAGGITVETLSESKRSVPMTPTGRPVPEKTAEPPTLLPVYKKVYRLPAGRGLEITNMVMASDVSS